MRILFVTSYAELMGANRSMLGLIKHLKDRGIDPVVLLPFKGRIISYLEELQVEFYVKNYKTFKAPLTGWRSKCRFFMAIIYNLLYSLPLLYIHFRNYKISIVHSNTSVCDIGLYLAAILGCKHIWHLREFGYDDYRLTCPYKKYESYVYNRKSTAFIAISQAIKDFYLHIITQNPIYKIYNGVELPNIQDISVHNNRKMAFCCIGAVSYSKNQMQIIEAANILLNKFFIRDFMVTIVGNEKNEYGDCLKQKIVEYRLEDYVVFTGFCENIGAIYRQMDVGIMPSISEAFGRVTIEYMLHNLLVIASNRGANMELIEHGKTGLLYDIDCTDSLAELMLWSVQNKQTVLKIAEQGKNMAEKCYTAEINADNIMKIYTAM